MESQEGRTTRLPYYVQHGFGHLLLQVSLAMFCASRAFFCRDPFVMSKLTLY